MAVRLVLAGGGTGGHVFPALAVAEQLKSTDARAELLFIGTDKGFEAQAVPAAGYRLETLPVDQLVGVSLWRKTRTLAALPKAVLFARRLLKAFQPHVVVGVGGYASGPAVIAASLLRLPIVLLEQNAIPGRTNRRLARFATAVVVAYPRAAEYFDQDNVCCLGNPLRPQLAEELSHAPLPGTGEGLRLLVLGGSRGAQRLNDLLCETVEQLLRIHPLLTIEHQTGETDFSTVAGHYAQFGGRAIARPFIHDIGRAYCAADLVFCRSGATSIAEITASGRPAVFVPYPHAADDHQSANARPLVEAGAAICLTQASLDGSQLVAKLTALLSDRSRLGRMAEAMRRQAHPRAAADVVALINRLHR
ncbi:MAG: undecaprenyldiphospho-muramoylpentapeptide beta-N-acetylglucosaminyltransferase [Deltaproteobacteria bacterium]|nr:undecaprenyldiphospho-muramoylpentapeptide beta-N-acetylglucosaminyltransferase [Deltaproteobacteria bacterium]